MATNLTPTWKLITAKEKIIIPELNHEIGAVIGGIKLGGSTSTFTTATPDKFVFYSNNGKITGDNSFTFTSGTQNPGGNKGTVGFVYVQDIDNGGMEFDTLDNNSGASGSFNFYSGNAIGGNSGDFNFYAGHSDLYNGGSVIFSAGDGKGSASWGGSIFLECGDSASTSSSYKPGAIFINAGNAIAGNQNGGNIFMTPGSGNVSGNGGSLYLGIGNGFMRGGTTGKGGTIYLEAGRGGSTSGIGGDIYIKGGRGNGAGNASGDIFIQEGIIYSSSTRGRIKLTSATSSFNIILNLDSIATSDKTITFQNLTGTIALLENKLSAFAATTSAELAGIISNETGSGLLVFATNPTLSGITMTDATDIVLNATTGTKIGTATGQKLAFYNSTPVVQPTALTTQLTSITHTAPGTPDYALQDLVQNTGFGFATKDEGNTILSVILNLQTRVSELETKLQSLGLLA